MKPNQWKPTKISTLSNWIQMQMAMKDLSKIVYNQNKSIIYTLYVCVNWINDCRTCHSKRQMHLFFVCNRNSGKSFHCAWMARDGPWLTADERIGAANKINKGFFFFGKFFSFLSFLVTWEESLFFIICPYVSSWQRVASILFVFIVQIIS